MAKQIKKKAAKTRPKIVTRADGSQVKAGSALDPGSKEGKARISKQRVDKALSKVQGDLKTRVVAAQKASVERGGVQRQANEKTGDPGELSVQKDTTRKANALDNEPTNRGLKRAFDNAAQAKKDAAKKRKNKG